jgi:hypothetical protein
MTAFGRADADVAVILRFELDEAAQKRVEQGISSISEELDKIRKQTADETAAKAAQENVIKGLKAQATEALRTQSAWRRLQFTARSMGEVFQITALASTAIFVGAAAWATKFVNNAKASTPVIQAWRVAADSLATSQTRGGAVLAGVMLPLLEKAAALADKAATFAEKHPDLLKAAVNVAGVVAVLSAIGIAVSKGFKIYADIGYMLATRAQVAAAAAVEAASATNAAAAAVDLEAANIHMAAATLQVTGVPLAGAATTGLVATAQRTAAIAQATGTAAAWEKARLAEAAVWKAGAAGATAAGTAATAAATAATVASAAAKATLAAGYGLKAGGYYSLATGRYVSPAVATVAPTAAATATKLSVGTVMITAAALIIGAEVGLSLGNAIAKLIYGPEYEKQGFRDILATFEKGSASIWGAALLGLEKIGVLSDTATKAIWKIVSWLPLKLEGEKAPAAGTAAYMDLFVKQNLQLYIDYNKQITAATESYGKQRAALEVAYEKQRTQTAADYAKQRAAAETSYHLGVSRDWRAYIQSEGDAQRQYYASRTQALADNNKRLQEMEQDHQLGMARDLEDHEIRQRDLLETRDGLAMIREDEQYELERRRKEEDFALEVSRLSSETAARLREMESQFAQERATRRRDFLQRLADNAAQHKIEMEQMAADHADAVARAKAEYDDQVAALADSYREQISTLETAFKDRLRSLDAAILGDLAAVQAATAKMVASFRAWLIRAAQLNLPAPTGTKAAGGYADYGLYWLGEGRKKEFVLNNRSTQIAERAIGGQLSQERILAAMMGGGGRGGRYVDQRTIQFTGVTEADRAAIRRDMYEVSYEVVAEAMKQ